MIAKLKKRVYGSGGLRKELVTGAIGSFGLKAMHAPLNVAVAIVLARALAPEGYGSYAFALSVTLLLGVPVQMGLPVLVMREVARYQYAERWDLLRGILKRANQAVVIIGLGIMMAAAVGGWFLRENIDNVQWATSAWALLLLPLIALNRLRGAALQGFRRVVQGQLPEMLLQPLFQLFLLGAAFVLMRQRTDEDLPWLEPPAAMALYCAAVALSFVIGARLLLRSLPQEVKSVQAAYETPAWIRSVMPLALLAGLQIANNQADIFMLGLMSTKEQVGHYRAALSLAAVIIFTLMAQSKAISPHLARLYTAGDMLRLQRLVTYNARIILIAAVPIAGVLMLFAGPILGLLFGEAYRGGAAVLAILCLGQLVNAGMGAAGPILNMTGYERETVKGVALAAISNICLNGMLIPRFGAEGAAFATAISLMIWHIFLCRAVWRHLGIQSTAFYIPMLNSPSRPDSNPAHTLRKEVDKN